MTDNENLENEEMKKTMEEEKTEQPEVVEEVETEEPVEEVNKTEEVQDGDYEKQLEEAEDRYKRLFAEFENFKKRNLKEKESLRNMLVSDIMTSILPIIDNLEKAITAGTSDESYEEGIKMILKQLKDDKLGQNIIKEEFRKGYIIGNKVIRHSMVIVAN